MVSSLFCGEAKGDKSADERLMVRYNFKLKYASQRLVEKYGVDYWMLENPSTAVLNDGAKLHIGGTPDSEPYRPYGIHQNGLTRVTVNWNDGEIEYQRKSNTLLVEQWDYKGLHILENGDRLKIIHPNEKTIVWDGVIELKPFQLFTEHVNGVWIHADQNGFPGKNGLNSSSMVSLPNCKFLHRNGWDIYIKG